MIDQSRHITWWRIQKAKWSSQSLTWSTLQARVDTSTILYIMKGMPQSRGSMMRSEEWEKTARLLSKFHSLTPDCSNTCGHGTRWNNTGTMTSPLQVWCCLSRPWESNTCEITTAQQSPLIWMLTSASTSPSYYTDSKELVIGNSTHKCTSLKHVDWSYASKKIHKTRILWISCSKTRLFHTRRWPNYSSN